MKQQQQQQQQQQQMEQQPNFCIEACLHERRCFEMFSSIEFEGIKVDSNDQRHVSIRAYTRMH
eukprot:753397-Hanusia_phi.AAC.1